MKTHRAVLVELNAHPPAVRLDIAPLTGGHLGGVAHDPEELLLRHAHLDPVLQPPSRGGDLKPGDRLAAQRDRQPLPAQRARRASGRLSQLRYRPRPVGPEGLQQHVRVALGQPVPQGLEVLAVDPPFPVVRRADAVPDPRERPGDALPGVQDVAPCVGLQAGDGLRGGGVILAQVHVRPRDPAPFRTLANRQRGKLPGRRYDGDGLGHDVPAGLRLGGLHHVGVVRPNGKLVLRQLPEAQEEPRRPPDHRQQEEHPKNPTAQGPGPPLPSPRVLRELLIGGVGIDVQGTRRDSRTLLQRPDKHLVGGGHPKLVGRRKFGHLGHLEPERLGLGLGLLRRRKGKPGVGLAPNRNRAEDERTSRLRVPSELALLRLGDRGSRRLRIRVGRDMQGGAAGRAETVIDRDVGPAGRAGLGGPLSHLEDLLGGVGKRNLSLPAPRGGRDPGRLFPPPRRQLAKGGQRLRVVIVIVLLLVIVIPEIGVARKKKAEDRGDQVEAPVNPELGRRHDAEQGGQHQESAAHPVAPEGGDPAGQGQDDGGDSQAAGQPVRYEAVFRRHNPKNRKHTVRTAHHGSSQSQRQNDPTHRSFLQDGKNCLRTPSPNRDDARQMDGALGPELPISIRQAPLAPSSARASPKLYTKRRKAQPQRG